MALGIPKEVNSESTDHLNPLDTSLPGREEEVIDQSNNNPNKIPEQQTNETGEKRFKEGLQDNSNTDK